MSPKEMVEVLLSTLDRAITTGRRVRLVLAFEVSAGLVVVDAPGGRLAVPAEPFAVPAMGRRP